MLTALLLPDGDARLKATWYKTPPAGFAAFDLSMTAETGHIATLIELILAENLVPRDSRELGACIKIQESSVSILKRLFSKTEPPVILTGRLSGPRAFEIEVGDLSFKNLDIYWKATSNEWRRTDADQDFYELQVDATLVSDSESRIPHAVCVEVGGKVVGHLQHADALRLHRRVKELGYGGIRSKCDAAIVGRVGHWAVSLDLDPTLPATKPAASGSTK